jgi:hypothetical protein
LALSCLGKSQTDCISSTYVGTNAVKVDISSYVNGASPETFVDTKVLPPALQDVLNNCEGDCKYVAADFQTQTFEKLSGTSYVISTSQSTVEDKAILVKNGSVPLVDFKQPPGFEIDNNIIQGTPLTISGTFEKTQESCAIECKQNTECEGFNLDMGASTCDFFKTIDSHVYSESKVSFEKEDIPTNPTQKIFTGGGTNLGNQGALCANVVACNSDIQQVLDNMLITSFTTADLQSCDYCPVRKFDRTSQTVTNELGETGLGTGRLFLQVGNGASHIQLNDSEFY